MYTVKNSKLWIPLIVVVLFLAGLWFLSLLYKSNSNHWDQISVADIPKVLNQTTVPALPKAWNIISVQKYDDGFVAPSVRIRYEK